MVAIRISCEVEVKEVSFTAAKMARDCGGSRRAFGIPSDCGCGEMEFYLLQRTIRAADHLAVCSTSSRVEIMDFNMFMVAHRFTLLFAGMGNCEERSE
jgi:hypothetical protein